MNPKQKARLYKTLFGSDGGMEVLHDLAKVCNAYTPSHVQGDPIQTALNEGKRSVYLYVMKVLAADNFAAHQNFHEEVGKEQFLAMTQQENAFYD